MADNLWLEVDAKLAEIGEEYSDPKFYALKHVVEILSSSQPQALVEELRGREAHLLSLVDALAARYHSGFARSIQNYSQILQLFGDATGQVQGLKRSLADATRQLAVQSRHLHQQWRKSMMLEAQTKLLADVQLVVDAPGKIQDALNTQDWPAAVALLQEAAARLARDSLMRVMALRKVRVEVADACAAVQAQLLQELHARVYGGASSGAGAPAAVAGVAGRRGQQAPVTALGTGSASAACGGDNSCSSSSPLARRTRLVRADGGASPRAAGSPLRGVGAAGAGNMPQYVADALAAQSAAHGSAPLASLRELVGCLVQINGLDEAKAYLALHARGEVRRMIRRSIDAWGATAEDRAGGVAALAAALCGQASGGTPMSVAGTLPPAVHAAVSRLITAVLDDCLRALANLGRLLAEVADAPPQTSASHALSLLRQQHLQGAGTSGGGGGSDGDGRSGSAGGAGGVGVGGSAGGEGTAEGAGAALSAASAAALSTLGSLMSRGSAAGTSVQQRLNGSTGALERLHSLGGAGYARAEYEHVWQQMQEEVVTLLGELLHAQLRGPPAVRTGGGAGAGRGGTAGGWLAELADLASNAASLGGAISSGPSGGGASSTTTSSSTVPSGLGGVSRPGHGAGQPSASGLGATGTGSSGALAAVAAAAEAGSNSGLAGNGSRLVFSLDVGGTWLDAPQLQRAAAAAVGSGAPGAGGAAAAAAAAAAEVGAAAKQAHYGALLARALAGHKGGPYLTPAVYGPVKRFVEDALVVMRSAGVSPAVAGTPPSALGGVAGSAAVPNAWLLASLEVYVADVFLPQVWVDLRGQCTAMLESPDAFRPPPAFQAASGAAASAPLSAESPGCGSRGGGRAARAIVPAAQFAAHVVSEVICWVHDVPCIGSATLAGVVDALLGRVLEAAASATLSALGSSSARRLALRPDVGLVMAGEPDALLLGDPMAFYVPRSQDTFDSASFLAALKSSDKPVLVQGVHRPGVKIHGFGLEGEAVTEEVLMLALRERPASADQLLAGQRTQALVQLAALSESLDYVADRIQHLSSTTGLTTQGRHHALGSSRSRGTGGSGGGAGGGSGSPRSPGRSRLGAGSGDPGRSGLMSTLAMTVDRYRSLAGACARAVRLDLLLLAAHHAGALAASSHVCEPDDVRQVHPAVAALTRSAGRVADDVVPYLTQCKAAYTLGCVAAAAARYLIWAAQDISDMNALGAERLIRTLAVMQGPLMALSAPVGSSDASSLVASSGASGVVAVGTASVAECSRAYERAKGYYTLITLPADEVVRLAVDKPLRYRPEEWRALLAVRVPGRAVGDSASGALFRALDKAYNLSAGQKVAAVLEDLGHRVQAPMVTIADSISAGLKGSMQQARALLKHATEATTAAVQQAGRAASAGGEVQHGAAGKGPSSE